MPLIGLAIGRTMRTKDVSNLQLWAWQGPPTSLRPSVPQLCQKLVGAVGIADQLGCDMSVLRCRAQLGMTQQNLNDPDIRSGLKQMRCKAVTQRM